MWLAVVLPPLRRVRLGARKTVGIGEASQRATCDHRRVPALPHTASSPSSWVRVLAALQISISDTKGSPDHRKPCQGPGRPALTSGAKDQPLTSASPQATDASGRLQEAHLGRTECHSTTDGRSAGAGPGR